MPFCPKGPTPKRRSWRRWPPEALEIVKKKKPPAALCQELQYVSGNDTRACWYFLNKHGIPRPGSATRHRFDRVTCDKLIEYISHFGVQAAAQKFGYSSKSLYNLLYRQEHTRMGKGTMSLRQISMLLRMRFREVRGWVERGLLKARLHEFKSGAVSYLVDLRELRRFCKAHPELLLTPRSCPGRINFLEEFLFAPKHAEQPPSRETKREADVFERRKQFEKLPSAQRAAHRSFGTGGFSQKDSSRTPKTGASHPNKK